MDYHKMYFPKTEMSQLTTPLNSFTDDPYSAYADNFDLSLLPNETEFPLSRQSDFSSSSSINPSSSAAALPLPSSSASSASSTSSSSSPTSDSLLSHSASQSPHGSLEYIPTTIYHDQTVTQIKVEKPWADDTPTAQHSSTSLNQTNSLLLKELQLHYKIYPSPEPSPPLPDHSKSTYIYHPPSPCPSIDANSPYSSHHQHHQIKQEYHFLPPSPPESSCGVPSPHSFTDIKQEPDETFIDIDSMLEKSLSGLRQDCTTGDSKPPLPVTISHQAQQQTQNLPGHQLLREYLEDTTFQKRHNLKPLALESLFGGFCVRGDIEPVISLALEHAKREAEATCTKLQISGDPQKWSPPQVHAWLRSTVDQFKLPTIDDLELKFSEDGTTLSLLTEEEFIRRAPEAGGTIHAQLEIWKLACSDNFSNDFNAKPTTTTPSVASDIWSTDCIQKIDIDMDVSDDEDEDIIPPGTVNSTPAIASTGTSAAPSAVLTPGGTKPPTGRTGGSHIHLWQFLKELLATPHVNGTAIRWIDRSKGVFKIEDSVRVAKLWGRRKNRPAMNYDKLSRSIRQYYKKGIMKKTERSQRLVYQFCHPYCL